MKNRLKFLFFFSLTFFLTASLTAQEFGVASIYQDKFHGKVTAYGRTYNKNELVAAHKKHLPGTWLRVTRLDNKKSVDVEVIDRGPFVRGRIVDLSSRAAKVLDMLDDGVANVKVEVLQRGQQPIPDKKEPVTPPTEPVPGDYDNPAGGRISTDSGNTTTSTEPATPPAPKPTPTPVKKEEVTPKSGAETSARTLPEETANEVVVGNSFTFYSLYKLELQKAPKADFAVQVAYLSNFESLLKQVAALQARRYNNILFYKENAENGALGYKVLLGPFDSEDKAQAYQKTLAGRGVKGFVAMVGENYQQDGLYAVELKKPVRADFGVQVASLTNEEGVIKQLVDLQAKWFDNTLVSIEQGEDGVPVYKIILGPFESEDKATTYKKSLAQKHRIKGFVVEIK